MQILEANSTRLARECGDEIANAKLFRTVDCTQKIARLQLS